MKKLVVLVAALVLALFPTVVHAVDSPSGGCTASDITATPYDNNAMVQKVKAQIDSSYEFVKAYDLTSSGNCDLSGGVTFTFSGDFSDADGVLVAHVLDGTGASFERVETGFTASTVTVKFSSLSPFLIFKKVANDTTGGGTSGGSGSSGSNANVLPNTDVQ